jgi:hypothetical protein
MNEHDDPLGIRDAEAQHLLEVILCSNVTVWHTRPGIEARGFWYPATPLRREHAPVAPPGMFVPTAVALYRTLLRIYALDRRLLFYVVGPQAKRDVRAACAALLLVQPEGQLREAGQELVLGEPTPKGVLRVAELLETPEIAALNREAGFAPRGRWKRAATRWLRAREVSGLDGLIQRGWKETIKALARKCGYRPADPSFFQRLGWKQRPR